MHDTSSLTGRHDASRHLASYEFAHLILMTIQYDTVSIGKVTDDCGLLVASIFMV